MMEFPRDIRNIIISKMDIDTRRALGIYTKLKCPKELTVKLTDMFVKHKNTPNFAIVSLGKRPLKLNNNEVTDVYIYRLHRQFETTTGNLVHTRLLHIPPHKTYIKELYI